MKESDYLSLIGETFYETIFMVGSKIEEPRNEVRKKLFRHILIRSQKVAQKKHFVTNEEFMIQCQKACNMLRIYCEKSTYALRKKSPTREDIDCIDSGLYQIDMSSLIPETITKSARTRVLLCNEDFKFIEECFENLSFEESQQPEAPQQSIEISKLTKTFDKVTFESLKSDYSIELKKYLEEFEDNREEFFIDFEILKINKLIENGKDALTNPVFYSLSKDSREQVQIAKDELKRNLSTLGLYFDFLKNRLIERQKKTEPESLDLSSNVKQETKAILTNETYYNLIMQGHKESLNAFECSINEMEVDHDRMINLYNDKTFQYEKQFKTLDNFIIHFKQTTLDAKANYRFVRFLESQQKIFQRDYYIYEMDFLVRCVDALNIKIDLEKRKYPNFQPKSKKGEGGGVITEGNRFEILLDSLVYYQIFITQTINGLNNIERARRLETKELKKDNLSDISEVKKNIIVIKEKYGNIFSNNGFVLFEHILNQYVKVKRGRLSDIHYFYWVMFNDTNKFIHQRPEPFKEWFSKTYLEDLGKIKTLKQVQNPDRDKHYSNALDWFKTQNQ
jgi:hypothetical protein